ncbi:hypothetical protein [Dyadobacter sp. CY326]|uniref:hypothetical protein n=1 Tax=Dyadobacter sp. CY326 TaxID=2907300 RepID=UPI001F39AB27|nr:hypothetical protein [Dyadobacter sp. CY326]MCE7065623.1 hypothetical protein [Dyadobacter sp. CY326]
MEHHNEQNFKKLLQSSGTEQPEKQFTEIVMQKLNIELQRAASEEAALRMLLTGAIVERPSAAFTNNVLSALRPVPAIVYKPIISKTAWLWIAASVILVVVLSFLIPADSAQQTSGLLLSVNKAAGSTYIISDKLSSLPELYALAIIGLSSLMLFDYFIRAQAKKLSRS